MEELMVVGVILLGYVILFGVWCVLRLAVQYMYLGIKIHNGDAILCENEISRAHSRIPYENDWFLTIIPLVFLLPFFSVFEVVHCIVVLIRLITTLYMKYYNVRSNLSTSFGFFVFGLFGVKSDGTRR